MQRFIINFYTKDILPRLIATLDVDSKFNAKTWIKDNTNYQCKDVSLSNLSAYNDALIDSKRVYRHLNILNIKRV